MFAQGARKFTEKIYVYAYVYRHLHTHTSVRKQDIDQGKNPMDIFSIPDYGTHGYPCRRYFVKAMERLRSNSKTKNA